MIKIKEVIKTLFWPLLFFIGQFIIMGLFMMLYILKNPTSSLDDSSLIQYINNHTILIMLIECIGFIPIFYMKYKKYNCKKENVSIQSIGKIIIMSFILSSCLNFIIILFKHYMSINISNSIINFTTILSTGIIGPIIEELLFRGIVYEKFTNIFKEKQAFYLSALVFAFFHIGGIFQIIFAFIIGCFLTYIYSKYHDIKISMIAHVIVNITSILISPMILLLF